MVQRTNEVFLNLGCYDKPFPRPFINVDIREGKYVDIVDDCVKLEKFLDNSVGMIYCSHLLEHLSFDEGKSAINRWYQVLRPGGKLRISVPDLEACFAHYFYWKDITFLHSLIYGSQRHEYDFHKSGYTKESLEELLKSSGFVEIKKWDHFSTFPNNYIDDYSAAYYPHFMGQKTLARGGTINLGGKLMSLNLEGVKPDV